MSSFFKHLRRRPIQLAYYTGVIWAVSAPVAVWAGRPVPSLWVAWSFVLLLDFSGDVLRGRLPFYQSDDEARK